MKIREQRKEIRESTAEELASGLMERKEELFRLRFQKHTNQLDNPMKLRTTRRAVARVATELSARRRAAAAAAASRSGGAS